MTIAGREDGGRSTARWRRSCVGVVRTRALDALLGRTTLARLAANDDGGDLRKRRASTGSAGGLRSRGAWAAARSSSALKRRGARSAIPSSSMRLRLHARF